MSVMAALARLEAVRAGRAQAVATVRHRHLSDRPLVMVPLRLAGEAAAPLAVMLGTSPDDARVLVVPQPRNRDLRFAFAADLAAVVLPYVEAYAGKSETVTPARGGEPWERAVDAPQILVPNPGGVAFLRLLGRSTRFRSTTGEYAVAPAVPLMGRWLTWLADRAEHPGSSVLLPMTAVLSAHWATGQSPLEDDNLAALLGWIAPPSGLTGPAAAARAEDPLVCPPAGPATDPGFDNEELAPLIAAYDEAATPAASGTAAERIRAAVERQTRPAYELIWQAYGLLGALPEGASVAGRWEDDRGAFSRFAEGIAEGGPQPKRDSAVAAALRLLVLERAADRLEVQRAYDDPLVMAERRLSGEAFGGVVVERDAGRTDTSGRRAVPRPLVTVRTSDRLGVGPGDTVHNTGRTGQKAVVVELAAEAAGGLVTLELTSGMGMKVTPAPGSVPEIGDRVCFATFAPGFQPLPALPPREETPWTHGGPPKPYEPAAEDAQETWS